MQWNDFLLPASNVITIVQTKKDLKKSIEACNWFFEALFITKSKIKKICIQQINDYPKKNEKFVIHGDTLSTLIGAIWGFRCKCIIAHVEAGLRSSNILNPFPEEITRRLVSSFARLHFPQNESSKLNLINSKAKGNVIETEANTLYDALEIIRGQIKNTENTENIKKPYVVANIHRFENLASKSRLETIVDTLCISAKDQPVYLVLHPPTEAKLEKEKELKMRLEKAGVYFYKRVRFSEFVKMIIGARYVITDGGSNQEECAYLGKPCLILRNETERSDGLEESCLLSRFESSKIKKFIFNPENFINQPKKFEKSPSQIIIDELILDS